jgi:hypothetical protein
MDPLARDAAHAEPHAKFLPAPDRAVYLSRAP